MVSICLKDMFSLKWHDQCSRVLLWRIPTLKWCYTAQNYVQHRVILPSCPQCFHEQCVFWDRPLSTHGLPLNLLQFSHPFSFIFKIDAFVLCTVPFYRRGVHRRISAHEAPCPLLTELLSNDCMKLLRHTEPTATLSLLPLKLLLFRVDLCMVWWTSW